MISLKIYSSYLFFQFEKYQDQLLQILLIIFIFGISLFTAVFIINQKSKKKLNNLVKDQKEKIGLQTIHLEKANHELKDYTEELKQQREEIKAQAESLETALKNLRELVEFKEGLVGMIVHDLKNPLNIVLNHANNEMVLHAGSEMLNMVNNILDVQKYETTKMPVEFESFNLNKIVERSISRISYLSTQKEINIENLTNKKLSLFSDIELTTRIYINLLTNAIKYTPIGGKITINAHKNTNESIKISITDNGPGIPEALKDRVFDKFTQIIAKKSGFTRSTGLGLTFCKLAVEAHGGEIGIDSIIGGGTTFWFALPSIESKKAIVNCATLTMNYPTISERSFSLIKPYLRLLKNLKVYQVSQIQKVLFEIKSLDIANIESILQAIENAAYSVNEEEYEKLLRLINSLGTEI